VVVAGDDAVIADADSEHGGRQRRLSAEGSVNVSRKYGQGSRRCRRRAPCQGPRSGRHGWRRAPGDAQAASASQIVRTSGSVLCFGTRSFKSGAQSRGTQWV
jgi:hypothetical protein